MDTDELGRKVETINGQHRQLFSGLVRKASSQRRRTSANFMRGIKRLSGGTYDLAALPEAKNSQASFQTAAEHPPTPPGKENGFPRSTSLSPNVGYFSGPEDDPIAQAVLSMSQRQDSKQDPPHIQLQPPESDSGQ